MILFKPVSIMERCFADEAFSSKNAIERISGLKNEECGFQLVYTTDNPDEYPRKQLILNIKSPISEYITVRQIEQVPVRFPCRVTEEDDYFLRREPGFYPDLLLPLDGKMNVFASYSVLKSLLVTINIPENHEAGDFPVCFELKNEQGEIAAEASVIFHCVSAVLPKQKLLYTNWFHCDCIANYYGLEVFDEKHWEYIEKFVKTAVKNGMNTILTPVFTPPLDTAVGHERRTVQLVDVEKKSDGWRFGFDRLERWVKMCLSNGIEKFEISHLYTQWGAAHAPKVMGVDENGEFRKLFGWETDSISDDYREFLRAFLKALIEKCDELGIKDRLIFHISDEPNSEQANVYLKAKEQISDLLEGYIIMDAMSDYELYKTGIVDCPVPCSSEIEPFLEDNIPDMWTYYCCGTSPGVSNRLIAMPAERSRVIGIQLWKYHIKGFLHWGYNFYNSCNSLREIDPYLITDGEYWVPAGDCFVVYPGPKGEPYETLHLKAFSFALQDLRALDFACELTSEEEVREIIEEHGEITFSSNPRGNNWLEKVRDKINSLIEEKSK